MTPDPTELGPYRIVRRAGVGGMGVVYEAVHTGLDKRVALKVLPRELAAGRLDRFLREARTAAALHHTNIVPVFDVGQVDGTPYYAMQFIDGRPLSSLGEPRVETLALSAEPEPAAGVETGTHHPQGGVTRTHHPVATTQDHVPAGESAPPSLLAHAPGSPRVPAVEHVVALVLQAAEGLAYAHDRGVVHRDVKPSNLLLDSEGVVWVADFGLAFRADDPTMTADGAILGTPRYMSPEQARAEKPDCRTDVYSLGVTLYELLTGAAAFTGDTPMGVIRKVLTHTPPRPRGLNRRIPRDLETVVLKAMAKNAADRYANGRAFADDLGRFLRGEPVKARRITVFGKAWRWGKRNPAVASLLATVFLSLASGVGVSAFFAKQASDREREARTNEAEAKRNEKLASDLYGQLGRTTFDLELDKYALQVSNRENRRLLYSTRVNLAGVALREGDYRRTSELLADTFPRGGEEDLRGWEWHYLFRAVHPESRVTPYSGTGGIIARSATRYMRYTGGSTDQARVMVYDSDTGKELFARPAPPGLRDGRAVDSARSPNGRHLAFNLDSGIGIWDVEAGTEAVVVRAGALVGDTSAFTLSSDGKLLACPGLAPGEVMAVGEGVSSNCSIELWDVATRKLVASLPRPPDFGNFHRSRHLKFSPDGRWLGSLDETGRLAVWDLATRTLRLHRPNPDWDPDLILSPLLGSGFAFRPDGAGLAARTTDETGVELYDLTAEKPRPQTLYLSRTVVEAVEFSPDGRLAVAENSGTLNVIDPSGRLAPQRFRHAREGFAEELHFRDGGARLVAMGAEVREWDLARPAVARTPDRLDARDAGPGLWLARLRLDSSGRRAVLTGRTADEEERVGVLDLAGGAGWRRPDTLLLAASITDVAWAPGGKRIAYRASGVLGPLGFSLSPPVTPPGVAAGVATGFEHGWGSKSNAVGRVVVADADTGRAELSVWSNVFWTGVLEFSPCGRWLLVTGGGEVEVFSAADGRRVLKRAFPGLTDNIGSVHFTPGGLAVVSNGSRGDNRSEVCVVELPSGRTVSRAVPGVWLRGLPGSPVSPCGRWLAARHDAPDDGQASRVVVYDLAHPQLTQAAEFPSPRKDHEPLSAVFSPCGRWLAAAAGKGQVELRAVGDWEKRRVLTGTMAATPWFRFSPDGRRLLAFWSDPGRQTLRVWDTGTGYELLDVPCGTRSGTQVPPAFDGNRFVFARDGQAREFEVETLDGEPVPDAVARERLGIK